MEINANIPDDVLDSIESLVGYLEDTEYDDAVENCIPDPYDEEFDPNTCPIEMLDGHIYCSVRRVREWLKGLRAQEE